MRIIHLATIQHLPPYDNLKEFEADHQELLGRESEWIISRPNGGPFDGIPRSRADYFRRYQDGHQGEKIMAKHSRSGTAPKLSLNLLPRLQTVETVGHDVLAVIVENSTGGPPGMAEALGVGGLTTMQRGERSRHWWPIRCPTARTSIAAT